MNLNSFDSFTHLVDLTDFKIVIIFKILFQFVEYLKIWLILQPSSFILLKPTLKDFFLNFRWAVDFDHNFNTIKE